jgi:hypothetical protein
MGHCGCTSSAATSTIDPSSGWPFGTRRLSVCVALRSVRSIVRNEPERIASSSATPTDPTACPVCGAPALLHTGACVFCRTPGDGNGDPVELLRYLATRLPGVKVRRAPLGIGGVRGLRVVVGELEYRARRRKGGLELSPETEPVAWVDQLLSSLTEAAINELDVRAALSRAGWAWRPVP